MRKFFVLALLSVFFAFIVQVAPPRKACGVACVSCSVSEPIVIGHDGISPNPGHETNLIAIEVTPIWIDLVASDDTPTTAIEVPIKCCTPHPQGSADYPNSSKHALNTSTEVPTHKGPSGFT